jgi:hypothetical protein
MAKTAIIDEFALQTKQMIGLVGRTAEVKVVAGKHKGAQGFIVAGKGVTQSSKQPHAQVMVQLNQSGNKKPMTVSLGLDAVRETRVSRFIHQMRQLLPTHRL